MLFSFPAYAAKESSNAYFSRSYIKEVWASYQTLDELNAYASKYYNAQTRGAYAEWAELFPDKIGETSKNSDTSRRYLANHPLGASIMAIHNLDFAYWWLWSREYNSYRACASRSLDVGDEFFSFEDFRRAKGERVSVKCFDAGARCEDVVQYEGDFSSCVPFPDWRNAEQAAEDAAREKRGRLKELP